MAYAFGTITQDEYYDYYNEFMEKLNSEVDPMEDNEAEVEDTSTDESDLVYFLTDDEGDEDDEYEVKSEPSPKSKVLEPIPESTRIKMEEAHRGKLKWAEEGFQLETADMSPEQKDFPLPSKERPISGSRSIVTTSDDEPMNLLVKFVEDGMPSKLNFKLNKPCRYILNNQPCPKGKTCIFQHDIPLCPDMASGLLCTKKGCRLYHKPICYQEKCVCSKFHPNKEQLTKMRNLKTQYCRNLIKNGGCKFGGDCIYAHTKKEVETFVRACPYKPCKLTKKVDVVSSDGFSSMVYKNLEIRVCFCRHKNETIDNYIARTTRVK